MTFEKLARKILDRIRSAGMTGECFLEEWNRSVVTGKAGEIREKRTAQGQGLGIRVAQGQRAAGMSATRFDVDAIVRSVDRIIRLVPQLPEDPFLRFAEPARLPDAGPFHDPGFRFPLPDSASRELLGSLEAISGTIESPAEVALQEACEQTDTAILNTLGLDVATRSTSFARTIAITLESGGERIQVEDERETGYRDDLPAFGKIMQDLLPLLDRSIGGKPVPTGIYATVFHPAAGRTFLHAVLDCLSGWLVNRQRTWALDRLDRRIAAEGVTLVDDPHAPRSPRSRIVDGEGVPTATKPIISQGVLRAFFDTLGTAAESGRAPGNAVRGYDGSPRTGWTRITMSPGQDSPEAIIRDTGEGLFIHRLIGFGLDESSGQYSIGAMGRRITGGALGDAVAGITIAGNLADLLQDIDRIGNDLPAGYSLLCPTFRIRRVSVGGS